MNIPTQEQLKTIFEARTYLSTSGLCLPYRLYVPTEYDSRKQYPVLLFLHGAGERGTDNAVQLIHVIPGLFAKDNAVARQAIVVVPQCRADHKWVNTDWGQVTYELSSTPESEEMAAVVELLDHLGQELSTDPDRYYVSGISMGGYGTWDLISRHTERFAGAVPICGGADPRCAERLKNMPIHTVHGTADPAVPFEGTARMVAALRAAGSAVRLDAIENAGHDVWTQTSLTEEIWNWLFAQKR